MPRQLLVMFVDYRYGGCHDLVAPTVAATGFISKSVRESECLTMQENTGCDRPNWLGLSRSRALNSALFEGDNHCEWPNARYGTRCCVGLLCPRRSQSKTISKRYLWAWSALQDFEGDRETHGSTARLATLEND